MKKSELKNIIKECVKEVIFEEGVLSSIITEVAQGLQGQTRLQENIRPQSRSVSPTSGRQSVMDAIGNNGYEDVRKQFSNPGLFEGTQPIRQGDEKSPLAGVHPNDPGLDISSLPGFGSWGSVATSIGKK